MFGMSTPNEILIFLTKYEVLEELLIIVKVRLCLVTCLLNGWLRHDGNGIHMSQTFKKWQGEMFISETAGHLPKRMGCDVSC